MMEAATIIVPVLDEQDTIIRLLHGIHNSLPRAEVIIADGGCTDLTVERALNAQSPLHVRVLAVGKGLSASVLAALQLVRTPVTVVMDADLQHPPEKLPDLVEALSDAEVAVGVRGQVLGSWPLQRRLLSRGAHLLASVRLRGTGCKDPLSGFFAVRTNFFRAIVAQSGPRFVGEGYKVLFDLLKCAPQVRLAEVRYTFDQRGGGCSKLAVRHYWAFVRSLLT